MSVTSNGTHSPVKSIRPVRKTYARTPTVLDLPRLTEVQLRSFEWFKSEGLKELFEEISPIQSFNKNLELHFGDFYFGEPKYPEDECRERDMTFSAPLWVKVKLINKDTGEISEQEVFMGDFPLMTDSATFIINGSERVVVSQLIRSPGVYFTVEEDRSTGRDLAGAKLIPSRGAWLEFESSKRDIISVKVDRKRKLPVTILLRAIGYGTDDEIRDLFKDVDVDIDHPFIESTIERDPTANPTDNSEKGVDDALLEFYKRLRPGDPPTLDNAKSFVQNLFFTPRRYDLGRVGRYKLNRRLGLGASLETRTLSNEDMVAVIRRIIEINIGPARPDDIDHLGNRRVKTVGELIQNQIRIGLLRMERVVRERMSIRDPEQVTPLSLINIRPVVAATREFFGGSQLSQFMDQTNPLAELTHKRRLSALGPGGLRRERAGFDVRDVHFSHYGRICPIETPEGPNIGLIGSLASFGRVNDFGFIETPYRRVFREVAAVADELTGHELRQDITNGDGEEIAKKGAAIDAKLAKVIADAVGDSKAMVLVKPFASRDVVYLTADEDEQASIAQASSELNVVGEFQNPRPSARRAEEFQFSQPEQITYMDVSPKQIVGVSAALIPFLEHDDANRALMGSNMQRQAVPLLQPDVPIVSTGMELQAALNSGQVVLADQPGEVVSVAGDKIVVMGEIGPRVYNLRKYNRSNQSTCIDQHPIVRRGQRVQIGDVLADSSSTHKGELALGQDVVVAFLSWEGGNFEDAILVSESMVRRDRFTSIHIEKHEVEARDTKLGPEEITYDIPNVSEDALKDLDERGIIRVGADVNENDILVGKITPKGEKELSPEEKLLRAIFGDKAREVKDSSLRLPNGARGKVVDVQVFDRQHDRDLPAGVETMVRVSVAQRRKISEGDKMAGRHGNKGVISKIVPIEDMPYLDNGRPIDIILSPLGVPGRMNIGQVLETHLGWAASRIGFRAITPVFDGATEREIAAELGRAWLIDHAWDVASEWAWDWLAEMNYDTSTLENEDHARRLFIVAWLSDLGYDAGQLEVDEPYARRAVVREWLRSRDWNPDDIFPDDPAEVLKARWQAIDSVAIEACVREWYAWVLERQGAILPETVKVDPATTELDTLIELSNEITIHTHIPLPTMGKERLFDGKSGRPFDQPVTVGVLHMLKLAHLVEDKAHARSTGPYSLVTQQPLGGKAQFGGQRFGEMEVWALEAYGAAHTLQEMLTVKSDDTQGRVKTYEAIVKNEPIEEPGVPASFRVLVKELQSLGLAVEATTEGGDIVRFGKDDDKRTSRKWAGDDLMSLARSNR